MNENLPTMPDDTRPQNPVPAEAGSELLLLPDGRILAHHLTPELAAFVRDVLNKPDAD
jgi:hypothetical protein